MNIFLLTDFQCLFFSRRNFKCSSSSQGQERSPNPQGLSDQLKDERMQTSTNPRLGWPMRIWRRSSSQAPLQRHSSTGSENSYVSVDGVYAELNLAVGSKGLQSFPQGVSLSPSNTYSEISDPVRPSELNICSRQCPQEGTYENAGYVLSETPSEPNESSAGSTSTPSSAYYSDVSTSEVQSSKKKKKKRKVEDRFQQHQVTSPVTLSANPQSVPGLPAISNQIPLRPVHLNIGPMAAIQTRCCYPQRETAPLTIQHLPLEHRTMTESSIGEIQKPNACMNSFPLHQPSPLQMTMGRPDKGSLDTFAIKYPITTQGDSGYGEMLTRHCDGHGVQRPLPLLPSRQISGPQRRIEPQFTQGQDTSSALPSEYI